MSERSPEESATATVVMAGLVIVEELKSRFAQVARHLPADVEPAVSFNLQNAEQRKAK